MLRDIRKNYEQASLDENELGNDPMILFEIWLKEAIEKNEEEPTAMTLSTAVDGIPDSRIVLLKGIEQSGFVFYTNYLSVKGRQISANNSVALNFFWPKLERQVRVKGKIEKLPEDLSADYFKSRPRDSQIGAWASPQSREIQSRSELDENFQFYTEKFKDEPITKPTNWGGYRVNAFEIEFWQGRPNRLHDRIRYFLKSENVWEIKRLAP
ncbi:pyridoxamine 5'-phosphate oxidase [Mangrovibacterium diazotrophicum]|uniref:Pyridoxine/pyridoxamine 5'-phosphate oxidase n=1 Tax=Mangrovibacterium diazotrophicum TaxID=1261403 RepID=A0A419W396_9BACT|nr:pyridoxamine 5'-phosphate oxidase [Mangrovibacterium diazotrophicum]RKD89955.1 pyridoxamine 5'-phosphate oxidase [Mangrovibacterium diazotrophicum]